MFFANPISNLGGLSWGQYTSFGNGDRQCLPRCLIPQITVSIYSNLVRN